jgi:hypothetical protein
MDSPKKSVRAMSDSEFAQALDYFQAKRARKEALELLALVKPFGAAVSHLAYRRIIPRSRATRLALQTLPVIVLFTFPLPPLRDDSGLARAMCLWIKASEQISRGEGGFAACCGSRA